MVQGNVCKGSYLTLLEVLLREIEMTVFAYAW